MCLKEEIKEEALVRNLNTFQRFLEVAAISCGGTINYNNIARECGVSATTASAYFDILEDTLVGYRVPAYTRVVKRRVVQAPRFYFFDVGVTNYLLQRDVLKRGTSDYDHAFEHLVVQEIVAWLRYRHPRERLSYWRTYSGIEVDVVLGSHPHVIGGMDWTESESGHKTLMLYSLGNFLTYHAYPEIENQLEGMMTCDFVKDAAGTVATKFSGTVKVS